jgi:dimethylhistidine N-methyltransferase
MSQTSVPPVAASQTAAAGVDQFLRDVHAGLGAAQKYLLPKYFYDPEGSALFERITELSEYYLTRAETEILSASGPEISARIGPGALIVEYGSGSSTKTRLLLDRLVDPAGYVPIDISCEVLETSARALADEYPGIEIRPLCADYTGPYSLPHLTPPPARVVGFFPGSTIGNFEPGEARRFLGRVCTTVGPGGGLLIGFDLKKAASILEAAYDDAQGVTARFNLNLLERINRELGGTFDLTAFRHRAVYNEPLGRVEMHLVSARAQSVRVGDRVFDFAPGEWIHTESSYKFDRAGIAELAEAGGFSVVETWTDANGAFCLAYLEAGGIGA